MLTIYKMDIHEPDIEEVSQEVKDILKNIYEKEKMYFGRDKVYKYAKEKYPNVPGLTKRAVMAWLRASPTWQRTVRVRRKRQHTEVFGITRPGYFSLDIKGPLPKAQGGYQYILICVQLNNRLMYALPMRTTSAKETADKFLDLMMDHQLEVKVVRTDNGASFQSDFTTLCEELGVTQIFSAPHSPWQNLAERYIGTLQGMINKLEIMENKTAWYKNLQILIDNINKTWNCSLGKSAVKASESEVVKPKKYKIKKPYKTAFKVNDVVRLRIRKKTGFKPLKQPFSKELYVIGKVNHSKGVVTYKIHRDGNAVKGLYNATDLLKISGAKPSYYSSIELVTNEGEILRNPSEQQLAIREGETLQLRPAPDPEGRYEVEKIIGQRRTRTGMKYLVLWKGYGENEATWLPRSELQSAQTVLREWRQEQRAKGG